MSASIIQFPSRGPAMLDREPLPTNLRRSRAGAVSFTSQEHMGQNSNPARKVIIVRWTAPAAGILAGEGAAYCADLSSLFIRGAITDDFKNFCRSFGRPATLLLPRIQPAKQPRGGFFQRFNAFRGFVLGHAKQLTHGELYCQTIPLKDRTRCL